MSLSQQVRAVQEYYRLVDAGQPVFHLFTEDFQFYFPKFGIGHGANQFLEFVAGLLQSISAISHHIDEFKYIEGGNCVVVEGTTEGKGHAGGEWHGGKTSGGRFCNVFEFTGGLISRMHIYLDPDYFGADTARFLWRDRPDSTW